MRLLVTRPDDDAGPLIAALEGQGHDVLHAPMLTIRYVSDAVIPARDWAGLLFTSASGVRALAARDDLYAFQHLPVFTVGEASARAARNAGFTRVTIAGGDVVSLAQTVAENVSPSAPFLHVAGSVVAGDLGGDLAARGHEVHRVVLYEAERVSALPQPVIRALGTGGIDGVLFFSPRTASGFADAVQKAGLQGALGGVTGFCLSPAVALSLENLSFARVLIAVKPEQAALLALIG
ncbi:MAG: uroporphyrinogen-III synthase [Pseudomonadota bacterium]